MNASLLWIITGLILLIAEMATGTIVILFIAVGCFVSAIASILFPDMITLQIIICAVVSLIGGLGLRKPLQQRLLKKNNLSVDIGKEIVATQSIAPHKSSRIVYQGTTWDASNVGHESISQGDHVVIVGIDGNILLIRKLD